MSAEVVRLTAPDSGATADLLVSLGFNCFSWKTPFAGEAQTAPQEILWADDGFESGGKRPSHSGVPLLAPFAGRIAGAAFEREGQRYELEKTNGDNAIHGFALREAWRIVTRTDAAVTAEFQPSVDAPAALSQWPSDYVVRATYAVEGSRLVLDFATQNVGDRSMPYWFATHAYFRLALTEGANPEQTLISAPIDGEWLCDELIPTGEVRPTPAGHPLATGAALAGAEYDTPFRLAPGATSTTVVDPASGRTVTQTFDETMRCCVVYTPGHREAVCLEPYTAVPDAIALAQRGVETGLVTLAPGQTHKSRVVLTAAVA